MGVLWEPKGNGPLLEIPGSGSAWLLAGAGSAVPRAAAVSEAGLGGVGRPRDVCVHDSIGYSPPKLT